MKIAILGMGTVGSGVYTALSNEETGLQVKRVLDKRKLDAAETLRTENIEDILQDSEIEAIVETMGGVEPAFTFVMRAMEAKKHVITSNKHLVSARFIELHQAAAKNGVELRYSAAAGGGIPWLFNLARAGRCDDIVMIEGVINGTTNYILDGMHEKGASFANMLADAQRLGYAEADPSADIDGLDVRRKCAISASVGFNGTVNEADIPCAGVRSVTPEDIAFCEAHNYVCKLMFRARKTENGVVCSVSPVFVGKADIAAGVHGCGNIVTLEGRALGALSLIGQGAGGAPTGMAVVGDLLDVAVGIKMPVPAMRPLPVLAETEEARFYIRKGAKQYIAEHCSVEKVLKEGADFFARIKE